MQVLSNLQNVFLSLTSKRIFYVFLAFLAIGACSILLNQYPLWISSTAVGVYSLFLLAVQNKYRVTLSVETKNSPYFLGFLFTLTCLLVIFGSIEGTSKLSPDLVPQIGTALLTTILGLLGRHLILSYDPAQEQQERIFTLATEELKDNILAYRFAQEKLLNLVDDYTRTHKKMLEQEQKASKDHIELLSESSSALAKLGRQFPPEIEKLLASFDEIQTRFDEFANQNLPTFHDEFVIKIRTHLSKLLQDLSTLGETLFTKTNEDITGLIDNFNNTLKKALDDFKEMQTNVFNESTYQLRNLQDKHIDGLKISASSIDGEISTLEKRLTTFSTTFEKCNTIIDDGFKTNLENIERDLSKLASVLSSSSDVIKDINESQVQSFNVIQEHQETFESRIKAVNIEYINRLRLFKEELKQVDELINTFLTLTKKKLGV